jgi:hypothetical protein
MTARIRVRIIGQVRPGEDLAVDLIREIEDQDLEVGDSFRIGDDPVQIISLSRGFNAALTNEKIDVEWTVAPLGIVSRGSSSRERMPPGSQAELP